MEITREYILNRVETKLKPQYESYWKDILNLFNKMNIEVATQKRPKMKDSTVGWALFCSTVIQLIEADQEINMKNFEALFLIPNKSKSFVQSSHIADPDYVPVEEITDPDLIMAAAAEKAQSLLDSNTFVPEDIIEDFHPGELSTEGLRARGFINADATELDGLELNPFPGDKIIVYGDLINPFTPNGLMTQITSNLWMDVETEKEFYHYLTNY